MRGIQSDGLRDEVADWIVLDLKVATLHIMDPVLRSECYLEQRLKESMQSNNSIEDPQYIIEQLTKSLPRKIAGDAGRSEDGPDKEAEQEATLNPFNI